MRKSLVVLAVGIMLLSGCSASTERAVKDAQSEYNGGLHRTVDVYDQQGHVIRHYEGKIDVDSPTDKSGNPINTGKVKFDLNGKRVLIYNAPVIVEEK